MSAADSAAQHSPDHVHAHMDASAPPLAPNTVIHFHRHCVSESVLQFNACAVPRGSQTHTSLVWRDVLSFWNSCDVPFMAAFLHALRSCGFDDYYFECPPVSVSAMGQRFEFALVDAHRTLARRRASPLQFDDHLLRAQNQLATVFYNNGRDALLVVPTPVCGIKTRVYSHLASFARGAGGEQQMELWRRVGNALQRALSDRPYTALWLNTDGAAVPWLHVRLDQQPKYMKYGPYRSQPEDDRHFMRLGGGPEHRRQGRSESDQPLPNLNLPQLELPVLQPRYDTVQCVRRSEARTAASPCTHACDPRRRSCISRLRNESEGAQQQDCAGASGASTS